MSQARKMRRQQERIIAKRPDFVKAVGSLKGLRPAIDDTQTAVVQVLQELDRIDYETRRQRAVYLRMVMEMKGAYAKPKFLLTNEVRPPQKPEDIIQQVQDSEEQYRAEYDCIFALARGFMLRQEAEAAEAANVKEVA